MAYNTRSDREQGLMHSLSRDLDWWQKTIVYQIYPRSFQDSNGDGIGDLPGIISKLDHFTDLGVGAIWLSPFYPSPQLDFGYDISDFINVDPMFGSLEDFDRLIQACEERGIHVIIDFVPGHSSHLHPWFQKSVNREDPYTDYYVWHDGKVDDTGKRGPPNNWLSCFGGTAWTWNDQRGQFYYHPFLPQQPKLNYRCPQVVEEMKNVLSFWLARGVSGIRVDALAEIWEAEDKLLDEPKDPNSNYPPDQWESLQRIYTCLQPEGFELTRGWKELMDEYEQKDGKKRWMVLEVYQESPQRNVYRPFGGVPFNMDLLDRLTNMGLSGDSVRTLVKEEYGHLEDGQWPTFVIGNHDRHRVSDRFGPEYVETLNMLLLTLKGTPTTYYGEEIGMAGIDVTYEDTQDPFGKNMGPHRFKAYSRDPCRSPMQWDDSPNAGFSTAQKTWLPVHPNFETVNVKNQSTRPGPSTLKLYKTLAGLRQGPAFLYGHLLYAFCDTNIFSFVRTDDHTGDRYLVALNFGKVSRTADFSAKPVCTSEGSVAASTSRVDSPLNPGQIVRLDQLTLKPGDGAVFKL